MTYTPINWQTGDTITAEKMNKMDNGWGVSTAQLFSETVTTESSEYGNEGQLSFSGITSSPTAIVTFAGQTYQCPLVSMSGGQSGYGGVTSDWSYNFETYPFALVFSTNDGNFLATETAGTYAIAVSTKAVNVSDDFATAVDNAMPTLELVVGETTWQDVYNALAAGKFVYCVNKASEYAYYNIVMLATSENGFLVYTLGISGAESSVITKYSAPSANGALDIAL